MSDEFIYKIGPCLSKRSIVSIFQRWIISSSMIVSKNQVWWDGIMEEISTTTIKCLSQDFLQVEWRSLETCRGFLCKGVFENVLEFLGKKKYLRMKTVTQEIRTLEVADATLWQSRYRIMEIADEHVRRTFLPDFPIPKLTGSIRSTQ